MITTLVQQEKSQAAKIGDFAEPRGEQDADGTNIYQSGRGDGAVMSGESHCVGYTKLVHMDVLLYLGTVVGAVHIACTHTLG